MNIFYLSTRPEICAMLHCDAHVVKMILETAQILYSCHYTNNGAPPTADGLQPYRLTHANHPSCVWARSAAAHYNWLCDLGMALCARYTEIYKRTHKTQRHIELLAEVGFPGVDTFVKAPPPAITKYATKGLPPNIHWMALAIDDNHKGCISSNAKTSYLKYYASKYYSMKKPMRYNKRDKLPKRIKKYMHTVSPTPAPLTHN